MLRYMRAGLQALATLGVAVPALGLSGLAVSGLTATQARAEVAASEVLTWCDGASRTGQLGAINAFRCVNYLQGAADMVRALTDTSLGACLDSGQSAGAQLMARFIPELQQMAATEDVDSVPVARHVADWLAKSCDVEFALAAGADAPTRAPSPIRAETVTDTQADAAIEDYERQIADLRAALEIAVTGQTEQLAACTASLDEITTDLATAEAQAAESGMLASELELELEATSAEAIARRQDIAEAEARLAELAADLETAMAARSVAEQSLTEARRDAQALTDQLSAGNAQAEAAQRIAAAAADRLVRAEEETAAAEARVAALESDLASSQTAYRQLATALETLTATAAERANRLAALEIDLESCRITLATAELPPSVPAPSPTPPRTAAITPPSVVSTPTPFSPPAPRINSTTITGTSLNSPGSSIDRGPIQQLDAVGLDVLRRNEQAALRQDPVGQRRGWQTADARFNGFAMILSEGYQGPDYCRQVYSQARSAGSVIYDASDLFCRSGNMWIRIP